MIDFRRVELDVLAGIGDWLRRKFTGSAVEMVRANQVGKTPPYPYISYTVITPMAEKGGTYAEELDGTLTKPVEQVWSFTVQSEDHDQAQVIAMLARDYLIQAGTTFLGDRGIVVSKAGSIGNRDNFITNHYEKRQGFDCTFVLINRIGETRAEMSGVIEELVMQRKKNGRKKDVGCEGCY